MNTRHLARLLQAPSRTGGPGAGGARPAKTGDPSLLQAQQVQSLRETLLERARWLGHQVREVEQERAESFARAASDTVEDLADQGEHLSRDTVRQAEVDRDAGELRQIDAALRRIEEGRYGRCEECDQGIGLARLTVQPAAARCIECQQRLEQAQATTGLPPGAVVA